MPSLTAPALALELLTAARRYHRLGRWWCELFLLMPDHLHALIVFPRESGMSLTLRDWKRGTALFQDVHWQENYFDHRIRNEEEAREKWDYIRRNPVVKGLCAREDDWPWWISSERGTH
jgi:putative transposase